MGRALRAESHDVVIQGLVETDLLSRPASLQQLLWLARIFPAEVIKLHEAFGQVVGVDIKPGSLLLNDQPGQVDEESLLSNSALQLSIDLFKHG